MLTKADFLFSCLLFLSGDVKIYIGLNFLIAPFKKRHLFNIITVFFCHILDTLENSKSCETLSCGSYKLKYSSKT